MRPRNLEVVTKRRFNRPGLAQRALWRLCAASTMTASTVLGAASLVHAQTPTPTPTPQPPVGVPQAIPQTTPTTIPQTPTTPGAYNPYSPTGGQKSNLLKPFPNGPGTGNTDGVNKDILPLAERLLGKYGKELRISGSFTTRLQNNSVEGTQSGTTLFNDYNTNQNWSYRSTGAFQQQARLDISGRVLNAWDVNATLTNARGGSSFNQIFNFQFDNKEGTKFGIGNVNESLGGNEFVNFTRTVQGVRFSRDFGKSRMTVKTIGSITRGITRRGAVRGNGTPGPYLMNAGNLIQESEVVRLNDKELRRDTDYRIDYYQGTITLQGGLTLTEADTLTFTYEAENFNTQPGLLTGMRWDFKDPRGNQYGITYIQQKAAGARTNNGDVIERFPVMADQRYRYQMGSLIAPGSVVEVRWLNRVLVENVDYVLNRDLRYFQLLTASLPPDTSITGLASLQVRYRPLRQNSLTGDRSVLGLDTTMRLTESGTIGLQLGQSGGGVGAQQGMAVAVRTNWNGAGRKEKNAWTFGLTWRDTDATFSNIDSTSAAFQQARRGVSAEGTWAPNRFIKYSLGIDELNVLNQDYSTASTTGKTGQVWSAQQGLNFTGDFRFPHMPQISLRHQRTDQDSGTSSASKNSNATTNLDFGWKPGTKTNVTLSLTQVSSRGRSIYATAYNNNVTDASQANGGTIIDQLQNSTTSISNTDASTMSLSFGYIPYEWMTLQSAFGLSRSINRNATGTTNGLASSSTGRNMSLSMNTSPFMRFRDQRFEGGWIQGFGLTSVGFTTSVTESSNGQSTTNYYNPSTTGASSIIPTNVSGQRTRGLNIGFNYTPGRRIISGERLILTYNFGRQLSLIPGQDNTENKNQALAVTFKASKWSFLNLMHSLNTTTFVGGQGDSNSGYTVMSGEWILPGRRRIKLENGDGVNSNMSTTRPPVSAQPPSGFVQAVPGASPVVADSQKNTASDPSTVSPLAYKFVSLLNGPTAANRITFRDVAQNNFEEDPAAPGALRLAPSVALTRYNSATYLGGSGGITTRQTLPNSGGVINPTGTFQQGTNITFSLETNYVLRGGNIITLGWTTVDQSAPNSSTTGSTGYRSGQNYRQNTATIGFAIPLPVYTGLNTSVGFNFNIINLMDRDDSAYNYRARTFNIELSSRF